MAGIQFGQSSDILSTLLGSCVGISIWCSRTQQGGLAHAMLDQSQGEPDSPGRFVDTSIPALVDGLLARGAKKSCLVAKICGGAQMFSSQGVNSKIGLRNLELSRELLSQNRIPLVSEHVEGTHGRVIYFDLETGKIDVEIARKWVATI